jgi:hypothetical protein
MESEATLVRSERRERGRTARVRHPRAECDRLRSLLDRPIRDAEENELGVVCGWVEATFAQPSRDR